MGLKKLWENWQASRFEKKLRKYAVKICHINTTRETREQIILELCEIPGEKAVSVLLKRYDLTLHDKSIKDEGEKEHIAKEIIGRGEVAIRPVMEFIRLSQNVSIPFDILKELVSEDEYVKFVLKILTTEEVLFDERVIEKRIDVMNAILHHSHSDIYSKMSKLIDDDDDRVKITALSILANQENVGEVREKLLNLMVDQATPPRLVRNLIDIFSKKEWKLTGFRNKVDSLIPRDEYFINKEGIIRRRHTGA